MSRHHVGWGTTVDIDYLANLLVNFCRYFHQIKHGLQNMPTGGYVTFFVTNPTGLANQHLTFGKIGWEHLGSLGTLEAAIFAIDDLRIFWLYSVNEYSQNHILKLKVNQFLPIVFRKMLKI